MPIPEKWRKILLRIAQYGGWLAAIIEWLLNNFPKNV